QAGQSNRGRVTQQGSNRGGSAQLSNSNRPNYQQMKKDRRLGPLKNAGRTGGHAGNRVTSNYSARRSVNQPVNNRVQSNRPNASRPTHTPTRRVNNPAPRRAAGAPVIKRSNAPTSNRSNAPAGRSNAPVSHRSNAPVGRRSNAPVGNRSNAPQGFRTNPSTGRKSNAPVGGNRGSVLTRNDSASILPHSYNVDNVSRLSSFTLSQGKASNHGHVRNTLRTNEKLIGTTRNGGNIWFFEHVNNDLVDSFNRSIRNVSIGVIEMPENLPSYLLIINDMIRKGKNLEFYVSWDKENEEQFLVELYSEDAKQLESIVRDIYQAINRRSIKRVDSHVVSAPSPWLSKQFNLNTSVDALAILEGIPYYTGVLLVNKVLDEGHNHSFDYEINNNHILLKGDYETVSDLVTQLKKVANHL